MTYFGVADTLLYVTSPNSGDSGFPAMCNMRYEIGYWVISLALIWCFWLWLWILLWLVVDWRVKFAIEGEKGG